MKARIPELLTELITEEFNSIQKDLPTLEFRKQKTIINILTSEPIQQETHIDKFIELLTQAMGTVVSRYLIEQQPLLVETTFTATARDYIANIRHEKQKPLLQTRVEKAYTNSDFYNYLRQEKNIERVELQFAKEKNTSPTRAELLDKGHSPKTMVYWRMNNTRPSNPTTTELTEQQKQAFLKEITTTTQPTYHKNFSVETLYKAQELIKYLKLHEGDKDDNPLDSMTAFFSLKESFGNKTVKTFLTTELGRAVMTYPNGRLTKNTVEKVKKKVEEDATATKYIQQFFNITNNRW